MFVKDNKHTEELVNFIRKNDPISIPKLKVLWKNIDMEKTNLIDINLFSNIIKSNVEDMSDKLVINF